MCPYMAGGRSRRGSLKAGTTVVILKMEHLYNVIIIDIPLDQDQIYIIHVQNITTSFFFFKLDTHPTHLEI